MTPRAARLAGALAAAAAVVVVVILPGRSAALAAPNDDSCAPLPVAMTDEEFSEASELPVPVGCSEVAELGRYAHRLVAVTEKKILAAANGAPNAAELFREVVECPICVGCMHHDTVRRVCNCGYVMHAQCFADFRDHASPDKPLCPICRKVLDDDLLPAPGLLVKAMKLFEEKRWMPASLKSNLPKTFGEYLKNRIEAQLNLALNSMRDAAKLLGDYNPTDRIVQDIAYSAQEHFPEVEFPEDYPAEVVDKWIAPIAFVSNYLQETLRRHTPPESVVMQAKEWQNRLKRMVYLVGNVSGLFLTEAFQGFLHRAYYNHYQKLQKFFKYAQRLDGIWTSVISTTSGSADLAEVRKRMKKLRDIEYQESLNAV